MATYGRYRRCHQPPFDTRLPADRRRSVAAASGIETAARAPSGGNLQPWHIDVVGGSDLDALKQIMAARVLDPDREPPEYDIYPRDLTEPYRSHRFQVGEDLYGALGIPRDDKAARLQWFARNFQFFGAPVALFCTVARTMGPPQWSDLGMYLQTVMLLLREAGLDSCPQECWAIYTVTIREFLRTPPERMLFTGMAIGYRDDADPANSFMARRASLADFAAFREFRMTRWISRVQTRRSFHHDTGGIACASRKLAC